MALMIPALALLLHYTSQAKTSREKEAKTSKEIEAKTLKGKVFEFLFLVAFLAFVGFLAIHGVQNGQ
jgi:hypothetical protein